ncbi:hypothetical protein [Pseudonocardia lacus]|uniref:hypothetical protein n=1 Tax=Pseudonocardia lacus TaxID=2835865 RepID=UPI001BDC0769|nr:hypothetical protein [Pseudonocardia lacus]
MTVTTTTLTRASALAAAAAGVLFIAVQIGHPHLDAAFATTTEYALRQGTKVVMAALALAGITGMYLRQVQRAGVLGLLGYLTFAAAYLVMLSVEVVGLSVLPALGAVAPGYVDDVLSVATGGTAVGDIGGLLTLNAILGAIFIGGGVLFGLALLRAGVLSRWAAALLAAGALATAAIPLLPMVEQRLFAVPVGVALIGLGISLWRDQRTPAARPPSSPGTPRLDPAGAR